MTKETKKKVKKAFYAAKQREAATCLMAMGAKPKEGVSSESWEGMMTMLSQVFDPKRKATADEKAVAVLAGAKWMVSHIKCELHKHIAETEEMIAHEIEAGGEEHEAVAEDAPADAPAEAAKVNTAKPAAK